MPTENENFEEIDLAEVDPVKLDPLELDIGEIPPEIIKNAKPKKVKPAKKEKATSTKGHYATNAEVLAEFHVAKEKGVLTDKMARYLQLIAERYSYHPWFAGYSFREDMVATAVVNLTFNWHKFNPEKSTMIFSYYTTSVFRSFLSYLDAEKKQRDIRDELLIDSGANPSYSYSGKSGITTSDETAFMSFGGDD